MYRRVTINKLPYSAHLSKLLSIKTVILQTTKISYVEIIDVMFLCWKYIATKTDSMDSNNSRSLSAQPWENMPLKGKHTVRNEKTNTVNNATSSWHTTAVLNILHV